MVLCRADLAVGLVLGREDRGVRSSRHESVRRLEARVRRAGEEPTGVRAVSLRAAASGSKFVVLYPSRTLRQGSTGSVVEKESPQTCRRQDQDVSR